MQQAFSIAASVASPGPSPVFAILSFEGPDAYARAGGLATRVSELTETLAGMGYETHLFFVGDPNQPGHEVRMDGKLHLHRWCQWISAYHPYGVYDGEEGKLSDWNGSLPPWVADNLMRPAVARGQSVVVLGEDWQTAQAVIDLAAISRERGWGRYVSFYWNANNTFGFYRIPWESLKRSARVTTVSRYMKHVMRTEGTEAWVLPNGIAERWFEPMDAVAARTLATAIRHRTSFAKVARLDPNKGWPAAVDAVAQLKREEYAPLLFARGGPDHEEGRLLDHAASQGLNVEHVEVAREDAPRDVVGRLAAAAERADLVDIAGQLGPDQLKVLYRAVDVVLANSTFEPFGLVGLEAMASGGVVFVGCTGEDYVTSGLDGISLQSEDPAEIAYHAVRLKGDVAFARSISTTARKTATRYRWQAIIERNLLALVDERAPTQPILRLQPRVIQPVQAPLPTTVRRATEDELVPVGA